VGTSIEETIRYIHGHLTRDHHLTCALYLSACGHAQVDTDRSVYRSNSHRPRMGKTVSQRTFPSLRNIGKIMSDLGLGLAMEKPRAKRLRVHPDTCVTLNILYAWHVKSFVSTISHWGD